MPLSDLEKKIHETRGKAAMPDFELVMLWKIEILCLCN